jgi:hypothetical protein
VIAFLLEHGLVERLALGYRDRDLERWAVWLERDPFRGDLRNVELPAELLEPFRQLDLDAEPHRVPAAVADPEMVLAKEAPAYVLAERQSRLKSIHFPVAADSGALPRGLRRHPARWPQRSLPTAREFGLSNAFVGVFVVAILGNAAEHATAISAALKDRMDLSIAIGSSVQVALFVAPVLLFASLFIGPVPLDLAFPAGLVLMVLLSVLVTGQVAGDGRSDWLKGAAIARGLPDPRPHLLFHAE